MQTSKIKTLLILKYLKKYSDEDNPLSTTSLIELLNNDGVSCERKSIYADIKALNEIGCNVISVTSPKRGFYLASRDFEEAEIRLLIDAVNSAGFITPGKSESLINKLKSQLSDNQAGKITSQVFCESVNKCDNEDIYVIIDKLDEAIHKKEKVKFQYKTRNIDKQNKKSYTTKTFVVSPYALIWKNDRYYLVCNKESHDNLMNLRIDRIRKIEILKCPSRKVSECSEYNDIFDVADYSSKMFNMFSGAVDNVKLVCELDLREAILDRFGAKIALNAVDINHFETEVSAAVSDGFVSWLMQFGDRIKVVSPDYLVKAVEDKAKAIFSVYQQ